MSAADAASYKARKEAFVSNLSGSSLLDINLVTLVAPAGILLWTALQKRNSFFVPNDILALSTDFLLNVCAILFSFTAYSSAPILLNVLLAVPAAILLLPLLPASRSAKVNKQKTGPQNGEGSGTAAIMPLTPSRPFITNYRGAMLVETCLGILAVDFPIFPRRFAKVETWGTSLMDIGVGSFVFSAGLVSARQLITASARSDKKSRPLHQRLISSLRSSAPLIILGLIRLYSVKGLDYAEHVTEYGVHWNFFFTLGLLPPFVELSDSLIQFVARSYAILAIVLVTCYELALISTDLRWYILVSPRGPSLLSKNREGVFSFIGYLAIFLAGRSIGQMILPLQEPVTKITKSFDHVAYTSRERLRVLKNLSIACIAYAVLFVLSTNVWMFNLDVSRRLANAPYVLWIAAYNCAMLFVCALIEHVGPSFTYLKNSQLGSNSNNEEAVRGPEHSCSRVLSSYNRNGLPLFLVANLLTGLVNLTFNTLDASNAVAMGVLIGYSAIITGLALGLDISGIKIKL